jgi:hypothetical protein
MRAHRHEFRLCAMYRVLKVKRSGYYAWLESPMSLTMRDRADANLVLQALLSAIWRRKPKFDYMEMFYNLKRRHGSNGDLSPAEFERRYAQRGS